MKTIKLDILLFHPERPQDILLFHPERPQEMRVEVRIPMPTVTANRLMDAQHSGSTVVEQNALYNLAGAVGYLNGLRGIPLRIEEVRE